MTSGNPNGAPFGRDEYGFAKLEVDEMSSGGTKIKVFPSGEVEVAGMQVGSLGEGDTIKVKNGRFYVQTSRGNRAFSECFRGGTEAFGDDRTFIQRYQLVQEFGKETLSTLGI